MRAKNITISILVASMLLLTVPTFVPAANAKTSMWLLMKKEKRVIKTVKSLGYETEYTVRGWVTTYLWYTSKNECEEARNRLRKYKEETLCVEATPTG